MYFFCDPLQLCLRRENTVYTLYTGQPRKKNVTQKAHCSVRRFTDIILCFDVIATQTGAVTTRQRVGRDGFGLLEDKKKH